MDENLNGRRTEAAGFFHRRPQRPRSTSNPWRPSRPSVQSQPSRDWKKAGGRVPEVGILGIGRVVHPAGAEAEEVAGFAGGFVFGEGEVVLGGVVEFA